MRKSLAIVLVFTFSVFFCSAATYASNFSANDNGWSLTVDSGSNGWYRLMDPYGTDHMNTSSWWGRGSDETDGEGPLDGTDFEGGSFPAGLGGNAISLSYTDKSSLDFTLDYILNGTAQTATITESFNVLNWGNEVISLALFKYVDFDLNADTLSELAAGGFNGITQTDGTVSVVVIPSVNGTAGADLFEIAQYQTLLDMLNDSSSDNLANSGSPFGPGNATFAFQWNVSIDPGESVSFQNTYNIDLQTDPAVVPEPATMILLGSGLLGLVGLRRKRK